MKYSTFESEYLIGLLASAIKGTDPPAPPEGIDWERFVLLAKKQQVYSIIAVIGDKLPLPEKQAKELRLYNNNELLRILAVKNEQELIEEEFEKRGIKYMLLKGSRISHYYPKQRMRQMSDVDVLYDGSKKSELFEIMNKLEYSLISCSDNSDDFTKKPFYTFEFHRELFFNEHEFFFDFSNVWDNAHKCEGSTVKYEMTVEDLYLHSIAHMYKHYVLGGFGVRFLVDTYLMLKKEAENYDREYIASRLKELNLTSFERTVREISQRLFDGGELSEEQISFLNKTLSFGIYGDPDEGIKIYFDEYLKKHGGKGTIAHFYLTKLFPSVDFMKRSYPVLYNRPFLLPLYYVLRIFKKYIVNRHKYFKNYKILKKYKDEKKHGG